FAATPGALPPPADVCLDSPVAARAAAPVRVRGPALYADRAQAGPPAYGRFPYRAAGQAAVAGSRAVRGSPGLLQPSHPKGRCKLPQRFDRSPTKGASDTP